MTDLPEAAKEELTKLTPEKRRIVLQGLQRKLWHLERTSKLSFKYEVCPVCNDVGSTLENPNCDNCYIKVACKYPFDAGFKDDQAKGEQYFRNMLKFMMSNPLVPTSIVVGGVWDNEHGRPSKIAEKMASCLGADLINSGNIEDLEHRVNVGGYETVVWMVDVSNDETKLYPKKDQGSVLIVSKVMRDGYTSADAAKRIFSMHGNAVIEIKKDTSSRRLSFRLADALSNEWASTDDVEVLCRGIENLSKWTFNSVRIYTARQDKPIPEMPAEMNKLINIVKLISDKVEVEVGGRYFGNLSTRCMKMFPSTAKAFTFVSPRNIDKRRIEAEDMVFAWKDNGGIKYAGDRKPSVDTAIQIGLYSKFSHLKFMIHGHAYVLDWPMTSVYFPCGDLREIEE